MLLMFLGRNITYITISNMYVSYVLYFENNHTNTSNYDIVKHRKIPNKYIGHIYYNIWNIMRVKTT